MPIYRTTPFEIEISRRAVFLDTNVLVAAFHPNDQRHDYANAFLEMMVEEQLIVPMAVIIETWGMLVGSRKRWDCGVQFLTWLNNPGNATLMPQHTEHFGRVHEITQSMHIDCVDAILMYLANEISEQCNLNPPIRIATFDTSDFVRCIYTRHFHITLFDLNTLEEY
jgi:predicted nucleic acid-binding protein